MTPDERTEMSALRDRLQALEDQQTELRQERMDAAYDLHQLELLHLRIEAAQEHNKKELSDIITNYASSRGIHTRFDALYGALQALEITWEE